MSKFDNRAPTPFESIQMTAQGFEAWLTEQNRHMRAAVATRAALRAYPISGEIVVARTLLSTATALAIPNDALLAATKTASRRTYLLAENEAFDAGPDAIAAAPAYAGYAAQEASEILTHKEKSTNLAISAISTATKAATFAENYAENAVGNRERLFRSAAYLDTKIPQDALFYRKLWHHEANLPWEMAEVLECEPDYYDSSGKVDFWREWYQGFLDGKPLDWELQRRVALIEDAIWEVGPEAVADEIEKIRAKFELEKRIEAFEFEAERDALIAENSRHGIGGNNPPDDKKIEVVVVETITMIWADIDALKEESKKDHPIKAVVAAIIDRLGAGLMRILALCRRLGEHAVKVAITASVSAGTATVIAKPELLESVLEAAKAWLPFL